MTKNRLTDISDLLVDYSKGNFKSKAKVSSQLDEIDSIIMGINMLGEELEETTISKNIFENIFNSVSNILFVVNYDGIIIESNNLGKKIKTIKINKTKLSDICKIKDIKDSFKLLYNNINEQFESTLMDKKNNPIYAQTSLVHLSSIINNNNDNYLVITEDITEKKEHHLQIIKTIINTQENERKRVADDLHDSLGQELSSIRMMISAINKENISPSNLSIINTCNSILEKSITDLRSICFNLMPASLESSDIITATNELLDNTIIETKFHSNSNYIFLEKENNIAVYRVIQEFLNNSIKHAKATLVTIQFNLNSDKLTVKLLDNGKGFNLKGIKSKGRGLMTMKNRIDSINGYFIIKSKKGEGTQVNIEVKCEKQ